MLLPLVPSALRRAATRTLPAALLTATTALTGCVDSELDDLEDESIDETSVESLTLAQILIDPIIIILRPMSRTFTGDAGGWDQCNAITAGPSNSIVVTGEVRRIVQGYNAWSRAYDSSGTTLWTNEVNTPSEGSDRGNDVVALADGTSVVAGKWYSGSNTKQNYFLTKLTAAGAQSWWRESTIVNDDMYLGVARDSTGALIASGTTPDAGGVAQAWIRKLTSDGSVQTWSIVRNGTAAGADAASKLGVDSGNNLIVVGYETNAGTSRDGWIAKYSAAGALQWNLTLASAGAVNDEVADVAVASNNSFAVVGKLDTSSTIRAYSSAGGLLWHVTAADGITWRGVAVDGNGNVLVTGSLGADLIVRKYTSAGALTWQRTWANAKGNGIAADANNRVLVCGAVNAADGGTDGLVLRYLP